MLESVFSIIIMMAILAVFIFYFTVKKKEGKDWVYAVYFLTIIVTGTVLYSFGMYYKNDADTAFSLLFVIGRAITCSLKSLSGDFQASAIAALARDNTFVAVAAFVHFIAAEILTFLVIIKLFGKNLINRLNVFVNSLREKYIVVGSGEQAKIFLDSFDHKKRKRTTVVLEAENKDKKKDLMFDGFAVVVVKERVPDGRKDKSGIDAEMLSALKTAGFEKTDKSTKIVAMSSVDETNLLVAKIVTEYFKRIINPCKNVQGRIKKLDEAQEAALEKINLSAYIMYDEIDRTEHFAFSEYALGRVKFFNPYEVRARKFIVENPITSLIPASWVNTEKARLYSASENGLDRPYRIGNFFVGFGFTNRQLLKKTICDYQLLGTDYNALVFDKDAKRLEKQFQNSAPGLFDFVDSAGKAVRGSELMPNPSGNIYYPSPEESYNINFSDLNVLSAEFYNRIAEEISGAPGFDFASVIIALGDDKLSIETALELRQKLYERRLLKIGDSEQDRVRIFVKIMKETVLSDYRLLNDKNDIDSEIVVFGASNEILNEDYIIHEKMDFLAKRIANDYWKISGADGQSTNIVSKWDSLTEFKRDSNRYAAMSIRTKLNLLGFDLQKNGETDSATIDAYNSVYGAKVAEEQRAAKQTGVFVDFAQRNASGNIIDNARNNLARLEHQRWNTLHLASGWSKLPIAEVTAYARQDEKAKQHACITTFEGLSDLRKRQSDCAAASGALSLEKALSDADTVCYDFDVMDRLFGHLENSRFYITSK